MYVCNNNNDEKEAINLRVGWDMEGVEVEWLVGPRGRGRRGKRCNSTSVEDTWLVGLFFKRKEEVLPGIEVG